MLSFALPDASARIPCGAYRGPTLRPARRAFEIPVDYEDWWHYEAFWREEPPEGIPYHGGGPKGLLRHAYRGILSDRILDRRRKGFGIPRYYLKDLSGGRLVQEHLLESLFL